MDLWKQASSVASKKASVSTDQPEATKIGIEILKKGGNAADAAVAAMAAVSVLQPLACGIGGDCHSMFYRSSDKAVRCINGSGRTGKNATLDKIKAAGIKSPDDQEFSGHGLWVSVPGAVAGMCNTVKHFGSGKVTMKEIFEPVAKLAEEGVPLPFKHAALWKYGAKVVKDSKNAKDLLIGDRIPVPGDIIQAPKLARCLRTSEGWDSVSEVMNAMVFMNRMRCSQMISGDILLTKDIGESGPEAFYQGQRAKNIIEAVQQAGGELTLEDLEDHLLHSPSSRTSEALSVDFHGLRIWEMKPNTIGIVALVLFNILKAYDLKALGHNSAEYIHILAEATKYAYLECWEYLCDPDYCTKELRVLLTEETAQKLRDKIDTKKAFESNIVLPGGNTSIVAVVDEEGNGCSLICSVSNTFGTGIIPDNCGFVLHDRARSMNLIEKSTNVYGPRKLPLHSILPALVTDPETSDLLAVMGVVGRFMQPQGHVQILINMVIFGMDPQVALNQPRFFVGKPKYVKSYENSLDLLCLEGGLDPSVLPTLQSKGHRCKFFDGAKRIIFGYGHVIAQSTVFDKSSTSRSHGVWWAGADPRTDGQAMGY